LSWLREWLARVPERGEEEKERQRLLCSNSMHLFIDCCNVLRLFPCQEGSVMPGYRLVRLRAAAGFCAVSAGLEYVDAAEEQIRSR
jgi:hypothetical protein